jgi:PhnB protein
MNAAVKAIPDGVHAVTPHLVCAGASDAIAFYKKAFNAEELSRFESPDGKSLMHAAIRIGNSMVMLTDENPAWKSFGPNALGGTPVTLQLYVPDCDAVFAQAVAAGGTARMPPADMFWGDRYGQVVDPYGHVWAIATHQRDLTPAQMMAEMKAMMPDMCDDKA